MSLLLTSLLTFLVPSFATEDDPPPDADAYPRLVKEYEAEEAAWLDRYRDLKPDAPETVWEARDREWPGWAFIPRFLELAEKDPSSDDALFWVVNRSLNVGAGDRRLAPHLRRALELLSGPHPRDERRLVETCGSALIYPSPWTERFLRETLDRSQSRDLRGNACLGLGLLLTSRAFIAESGGFDAPGRPKYQVDNLEPEYLAYFRETDVEATRREARLLLGRCTGEFAKVVVKKGSRPRADLLVGKLAGDALLKLDVLVVGKVAPDIEGEDADGKRFKLSDYRGKVVVLTFSGNWCGPCRAMYPEERELVERLKAEPFALLSVNTDEDRETLRKSIADGEVTWRCWWDGGVEGPITTAWGITVFPTVFILDEDGVIRHDEVRGDQLGSLVDDLLARRRR